jgi:hypothetical protein
MKAEWKLEFQTVGPYPIWWGGEGNPKKAGEVQGVSVHERTSE